MQNRSTTLTLLAATVFGLTCVIAQAGPRVRLDTNLGAITVELADDKAPKTVENFLAYARDGFYNGTLLQRHDFPSSHRRLHDSGRWLHHQFPAKADSRANSKRSQ